MRTIAQNHRANLEQFEPDGGDLCPGQFGPFQPQAPDGFHQHIGGGAPEQPELIGPPLGAAGPIGKEPELLFLDAVLPAPSGAALRAACGRLSRSARFHLSARTVDFVIEFLRVPR